MPDAGHPNHAAEALFGLDLAALARRPFAFLGEAAIDDDDPNEGFGSLRFDPAERTLTLDHQGYDRDGTALDVHHGLLLEWRYRRTLKGAALARALRALAQVHALERYADAFERVWDGHNFVGRLRGERHALLATLDDHLASDRFDADDHQQVLAADDFYQDADPDWLRAPDAPQLGTPACDARVRQEIAEVRAAVSGARPDAYWVTGIRAYCERTLADTATAR